MSDDEKARTEQAARLREEIEQLKKGKRKSPPRSPREFVEERMRELAESPEGDKESGEDSPGPESGRE